jgi:hypothetical protein
MIPVYQTIFSDESKGIHGNCFPACLASLLETTIEEIPQFQTMETNWFPQLWEFLLKHGYEFKGTGKKEDIQTYNIGISGYYIVNGSSPRGIKRGHAIVYYNGMPIHDPHPKGGNVLEVWNYLMIEPVA